MISSDVLRGYNDTMILCLLYHQDSYGYEIAREIHNRSQGVYVMKETTLYSAVSRLEKNGYIRSYSGTQSHGKQRTYYSITAEGRRYYQEKCKEWQLTKQLIDHFTKGEEA